MDRAELANRWADLARRWAAALTQVVYVPRSRDAIERDLADLLGALAGCLRADADPASAAAVGKRLVEAGFHNPVCVRASIDLLAPELPRLAERADQSDVDGSVESSLLPVFAAIAAGFAEATRDRLFFEQEDLRGALMRAKENVERDLRASEARFSEVFATSSLGMVISDPGGGVARANKALEDMLGHDPGTLFRKRLDDLFHPDERDYLRSRYSDLLTAKHPGRDQLHERTRLVRADGETVWVRIAVSVLRDRDGQPDHHVTMVQDISDLHLLEHQISHQGTHDPLTGLRNRQSFVTRLEEALGAGADLSVFHLGLDDFAVVNDGIGREAGDHLLRHVAACLSMVVAEHAGAAHPGVVARIAGDEFAILLHHGPDTDVGAVATAINEVLSEPTYVGGDGIAASATIAVVRLPAPDTEPGDLLRATDIAVRRLKAAGRRQWCLVDPEQNRRFREHYRLAASIPGAWENGELDVEFEPVVLTDRREAMAARALLRWTHPTQGVIDHRRCHEVLLDTGLGVPLGHWLLQHAAERLVALRERTGAAPRLYVELTAEQSADPDLIAAVRRALAESGLSAEELEIGMPVDSLCMADSQAEDNLGVLVELGVRSVLTGFGRTRGDLACVEDLPIQTVRMADLVVARLVEPRPEALFTRAIRDLVPMVRDTGVSVMVAGMETAAQVEWWTEAGADRASGPVFGEFPAV
ncbi:EAL domain-containing protein [Actinokineospora iranica]|uniref:PAS domain S-box-containing protein/diguanylate cyclase (GGDEF) domain-containing protein n=1 Tax=Actinokineospora iranica TaxID=1271860 RepID=A0A1G6LF72_9PSEU|nr:EAL domain-containing protein [Actinokineospora iranica]SDC42072.1 PAS domain S-box-containing protein/diguanylate cyclase (GGDEF) domain-containing protein [Actinokineospora iranica]